MAYSLGINSPFVLPPGAAAAELNARGKIYGSKVRVAEKKDKWVGASEAGLYWAYGKKTWARIGGGATALGFAGGRINSFGKGGQRNAMGDLALYSPRKHLPKLPLLTGITTTNEGALGSLIKGTFTFTVYPEVSRSSMAMGAIEGAYFKPGRNCGVSFGWSTYAAVPCASRFSFVGIIYDFQWSVNNDMSVAASVSVMTGAAVAVGAPGKQTVPKKDVPAQPNPTNASNASNNAQNQQEGSTIAVSATDAKQIPVIGYDMASIIDEVMADVNPLGGTSGVAGAGAGGGNGNGTGTPTGGPEEIYGIKAGQVERVSTKANTYGLNFIAVGIPWQPDPPETDEVTKTDQAYGGTPGAGGTPGQGGTTENPNQLSNQANSVVSAEGPKPIVKKFYYVNFGSMEDFFNRKEIIQAFSNVMRVDIKENKTVTYPWTRSAYPLEVLWDFGGYPGGTLAFERLSTEHPLTIPSSPSSPTNIGGLWFSTDHVKNTWKKFFTDNSTKIDQKNLTSFLTELCKRANEASGDNWQLSALVVEDFAACGGIGQKKSVLSAEDFNYHPPVGVFRFEASIYRPMIKSVSISCKPPAALASAALMDGKGGQLDTPITDTGNVAADATTAISTLEAAIDKIGINNAWCEAYRSALTAIKKSQMTKHHSTDGAIYPIDFGITVDGVSGFKFGESVTTNLLPGSYAARSFFTITKINHNVSAATWDTTVNAVMRLK